MTCNPLVSVVVLNWNGKSFLRDCLSTLMNQTYARYEIIFVDNGSTDGSVEYVQQNFPTVRIIKNKENLGFSAGNNIGFKNSTGKYLIALNNDTKIQSNFIEQLVKIAEGDEKVGSVGCKIIDFDGKISYGPLFVNKFGLIARAHKPETYNKLCLNLANCACCCLYRRSVIEEIGGFDEYFWSDWEDHDLGLRINLRGFKNVYTPSTSVLHAAGGTVKRSQTGAARRVRIIRNTMFTYVKNYEARNLVLPLIHFVLLSTVNHFALAYVNETRIIRCFLRGKSDELNMFIANRKSYSSLFRAYFEFLKDFRKVLVKRERIQKMRRTSDKYIFSAAIEPP